MRKYFKNRKNFYLTFKLKTNLKRNSFFFIKKNELLFKFVLFLLKKKSKKNLKKKWFRFFFFLKKNYFLTKKNRNSRMGKGKSGKGFWIIRLKYINYIAQIWYLHNKKKKILLKNNWNLFVNSAFILSYLFINTLKKKN